MEIDRLTYLKTILRDNHLLDIEWYYSFLTIIDKNIESKYLRIVDNRMEVLVNDTWYELMENGQPYTKSPIFSVKDKINLSKNDLRNLSTDIETTLGRIIVNKVLLDFNFNNKIEYINKEISVGKLEDIVAGKMKTDEIKVSEYISFADSINFLRGLSRITNISATPRNIVAPPGIEQHKVRIRNEFNQKYGENWITNRTLITEYQEELKKIDAEWLKDDPTNGKLISGKLKNNARVKMFLTFGGEVGFNKNATEVTLVDGSLQNGYPNDKDQLATMFNTSRSGSYDRGKETQKGGTLAKDILRATSGYKISGVDCGSKRGFKVLVTNDNKDTLKGRHLVSGKTIENGDMYIGKTVEIRSPMYCLNKDNTYCETCIGSNMKNYTDGISLNLLSASQTVLTLSLKAMHNTQIKLMKYNILDAIK